MYNILDALFYSEAERRAAEELAATEGVPFVGLWMDAPISVREERVKTRLRNPSDVKEREELNRQLQLPIGKMRWKTIMTDGPRDRTVHKALRTVHQVIRRFKAGH